MDSKISILILAGGIGSRFKTSRNKLVFDIMGKPVFSHVYDCAKSISDDITAVLGPHNREQILALHPGLNHIIQQKPLGTGDALIKYIQQKKQDPGEKNAVLVLLGDVPLVSSDTLIKFKDHFTNKRLSIGFISTSIDEPMGYGRIIRDTGNAPVAIKEEADLSEQEISIKEVNTGIFLLRYDFLEKCLYKLAPHDPKGEYYITDLAGIAINDGFLADSYHSHDCIEFTGINTIKDLRIARDKVKDRINLFHMENGVDIIDPSSTFIDINVHIDMDSVIYPNNIIRGTTTIKKGCFLGPANYIENCDLGQNTRILGFSYIRDSIIGSGTSIGPFAHLRMNNRIADNVRIGNYVEIKKSSVGDNSKIPHLSYVGDADIGKNVNIGAGVITCNYDGEKKHPTTIHDNAFIGSDSQLVAPVTIGEEAYIASGSTIVSDVPAYSLAVARNRQTNKKDWVKYKKRIKNP